jgi:hypothetical protein
MRASIADAAAATGCAKGTQARASAAHGYPHGNPHGHAARQCRGGGRSRVAQLEVIG